MSTEAQIMLKSIVHLYNRDEEVSLDELCKHSNLSMIKIMQLLRELIDRNVINLTFLRTFNFKHTAYMKRGKTYKPIKYFQS